MFCNQINKIIGKDVNNLFAIRKLQLRNSVIFYNGTKGMNCNKKKTSWPAGDVILSQLLNVSKNLIVLRFRNKNTNFFVHLFFF